MKINIYLVFFVDFLIFVFVTHHHHDIRYNIAVFANHRGQMSSSERNMFTDCRLGFFFCGYNSSAFYYSFYSKNVSKWFLFSIQRKTKRNTATTRNYTKPICTYKHAIVRGYEKKSSQNKQKKINYKITYK